MALIGLLELESAVPSIYLPLVIAPENLRGTVGGEVEIEIAFDRSGPAIDIRNADALRSAGRKPSKVV